jgi:hypothetical protein
MLLTTVSNDSVMLLTTMSNDSVMLLTTVSNDFVMLLTTVSKDSVMLLTTVSNDSVMSVIDELTIVSCCGELSTTLLQIFDSANSESRPRHFS